MKGVPLLVLFYGLISLSLRISIAADTVAANQSIRDDQTLVSAGQTFELGFFNAINSKNRYLGIWYKNINHTIAWVANRNKPLTDSSGVLTIGLDGNIALLDGSKSVIWSSSSSKSVEKPVVQLLDSGNLVLKDGMLNDSDNYLWQSFDYPSHMFLPGMKQGWDFRVGLHRYLTSWKNEVDPALGDFSYSIDLTGLPQLVLRNGLNKVFRSGAWNGVHFGGPYFRSNSIFKAEFVSTADEVYYKNTPITSTPIGFTLDPWGMLRHLWWDNKSHDWAIMFEMPRDPCDKYNLCGVNGFCNNNIAPACGCLQGFIPKSEHEFNRTGGCVRRTALSCGSGDRFIPIKAVKLPDMVHFWVSKNLSLKECEVECFKNCSCMAFANSDITEGGSGCILWFDELFDVVQLIGDGEQNLYIRLAESELVQNLDTNKKKRRVVVAIFVSVSLAMLLLGLIICSIIWKMRRNKRGNVGSQKEDLELPLFDLITIVAATDNFSPTNKIGKGGFGPVYKGKLVDGQEIAVKKLSKDSGQGITEFKNEVILFTKLQHRNLVKLLGCCIQGEEKMLVYEYMPNESLDYFVFDQKRSSLLAWEKRLNIVMGIARGLLYLHQDSRLRIIHRDLKTSNVLLDSNMNPKISDFGMARVFGGDQIEADTDKVVGTYGYMSPEYAIDGHFSVKSDVFSFGVLVLEIISGKKNRGFNHEDQYHNLLGHAWILWKAGKALELIETSLGDSFSVSEVMKYIQVGLLCVQQLPEDRPNMSSVVFMLGSENALLPEPKQPGFFVERSSNVTSTEGSNTGNLVTISILEAR